MASTKEAARPMTGEEKKVIFASSLGTVFEWYDFYLYGSLAAIIAKQFFSGLDPTSGFIFALLAFAAGFIVRPFGALVFGRLGDMIGRKYTFLVTILLMGGSTFIVGLLPTYATIGVAAPIILIVLRMLQGLALGGEYGGAATYVAEHAPQGKRGAYTSWIQTTATLGLFLSLIVILSTRTILGEEAFADWGWRIPFLLSIILLGVSVWIRLSMNESPAFKKMKEEGKTSKAPLTESFGQWKNLKVGIRPEFIHVWDEPFDDAMQARVVHVEDLGTYKIMTLDLDGALEPGFVCERVCASDRLLRRLGGLARGPGGLGGAQADAPALVLADALDQRQTQPQALTALLTAAYERLEHRFALLFGNTHAAVFHQEAGWQQGQADKAAIGVVQGIAQQIAHDRMQQGGVVRGV